MVIDLPVIEAGLVVPVVLDVPVGPPLVAGATRVSVAVRVPAERGGVTSRRAMIVRVHAVPPFGEHQHTQLDICCNTTTQSMMRSRHVS